MAKIELGTDVPEVHAPKSSHGKFDKQGRFIPDARPMAPPVGYTRQPSLLDSVREMVRSEALRQAALDSGTETFEEANDFYIEDEPDTWPSSVYENDEDTPVERLLALRAEGDRKTAEAAATASSARPEPLSSGGAGDAKRPSPKAAEAAAASGEADG